MILYKTTLATEWQSNEKEYCYWNVIDESEKIQIMEKRL